jgi:hypothetical protein
MPTASEDSEYTAIIRPCAPEESKSKHQKRAIFNIDYLLEIVLPKTAADFGAKGPEMEISIFGGKLWFASPLNTFILEQVNTKLKALYLT